MITHATSLDACLACNTSLLSSSSSVIWMHKWYEPADERFLTNFKFLLLVYEKIREQCHNINFLEVSEVHYWQVFKNVVLASL